MILIWGILCVVLILLEGFTMQLVSIWFAAGALGAFFVALAGGGMVAQLAVFAAVSALLLLLTRPILMKMMVKKAAPTNADLDIGETAVVIEEVNGELGTGRARRNGVDWIAISATGDVIPTDTVVIIKGVQGAKLIVTPETAKNPVTTHS